MDTTVFNLARIGSRLLGEKESIRVHIEHLKNEIDENEDIESYVIQCQNMISLESLKLALLNKIISES